MNKITLDFNKMYAIHCKTEEEVIILYEFLIKYDISYNPKNNLCMGIKLRDYMPCFGFYGEKGVYILSNKFITITSINKFKQDYSKNIQYVECSSLDLNKEPIDTKVEIPYAEQNKKYYEQYSFFCKNKNQLEKAINFLIDKGYKYYDYANPYNFKTPRNLYVYKNHIEVYAHAGFCNHTHYTALQI